MTETASGISGKKILLGVSGGIAAYKAPELVRQLRQMSADVRVVMTRNAHRFVTSTSLQAVSGQPVRDDLWDQSAEAAMGHIELARWPDLILIAPATADLISRLAAGAADDLLATLCLASRAPLALAPAMNQVMWDHTATQRNVRALVDAGAHVLGPDSGEQACGEFGTGRMQEPDTLAAAVASLLTPGNRPLAGRRVLITAGPTREAIDPVRYISNHSSGKQGYAMAAAARAAGADVTLVSGPVSLPTPSGVRCIRVTSAQEMHDAVLENVDDCQVFIGVAAVADYRPDHAREQKIKKPAGQDSSGMTLDLVQTPDIIASVARLPNRPLIVGFAAETENALEHARAKRARKSMDVIVVNDVSDRTIGFDSEYNEATLIWQDGERILPRQGKSNLASAVISAIADFVDQLTIADPARFAK